MRKVIGVIFLLISLLIVILAITGIQEALIGPNTFRSGETHLSQQEEFYNRLAQHVDSGYAITPVDVKSALPVVLFWLLVIIILVEITLVWIELGCEIRRRIDAEEGFKKIFKWIILEILQMIRELFGRH